MAKTTGKNNKNLKNENRGLLLRLIATQSPVSRIELAKKSSLTKMTVSNIVSEFIEQQIVRETTQNHNTNIGRNPIDLDISKEAPKFIGILINRGYCSGILCDFKLNILASKTIKFKDINGDSLMNTISELTEHMMEGSDRIGGIGIASVGPVDVEKGIILNPPNFYGIKDIPIAQYLQEKYHLPVYLDNHYDCAALAEKLYGTGKPYEDFMFLGITNGIGSGIIINGQRYHNSFGLAGEIGHTSIDYRGNLCSCGNKGCLETYASTNVVCKRLQDLTKKHNNFREFCEMHEDRVVNDTLMDMVEKLACGLVNSVNLLNPQAIIIGHEGVYIPSKYIKLLENKINEHKLYRTNMPIVVKKPYFGADAQLIGSVCCILAQIFNGNYSFPNRN